MNSNTMKLLVEYIAEQHRKERERYAQTYRTIYETNTKKTEQEETKDKE